MSLEHVLLSRHPSHKNPLSQPTLCLSPPFRAGKHTAYRALEMVVVAGGVIVRVIGRCRQVQGCLEYVRLEHLALGAGEHACRTKHPPKCEMQNAKFNTTPVLWGRTAYRALEMVRVVAAITCLIEDVIVVCHVQGRLEDVGLEHAALGAGEHVGVWRPACTGECQSKREQLKTFK